ncbi:MAG: FMN-dependent NADH-azoreductase [Chloroflexales bacterium]|nr:FMN-dependent NADH-azoreductase [Chloroflexales bacterium]
MTIILHIDSSPRTAHSGSRMLSREFVDAYVGAFPDSVVHYRDLAAQPPTLVDEQWITANFTPSDLRTTAMQSVLGESDVLIDELLAANLVVIGVPMHNFGVGTLLKCYIDQVVRAGRTFKFTPDGPRGLVAGKRLVVITTRGSDYSGPLAALDFQEPYLRTMFTFLGITDVSFISCNGMDSGNRDGALEAARQTITALVADIGNISLTSHPESAVGG